MTSDVGTCSSCGAELPSDAPKGFCPSCLYRLGFSGSVNGSIADPWGAAHNPSPSADVQALPPNRSFGDYELLERIGDGGMGVVYKACQKSLNRIVALKLLLLGPHAPPESVKRFRAEAVSTAALQQPNIVAIHEVGFSQGQYFIAMDYVEGRPLSELIRGTPLPPGRAARYLKTIAEAIHYAHERGILHRDLKPANVLIDASDQPRVTDFGLAKQLASASQTTPDSELTVTGQVLGSPNYMPPEQAGGRRTLSRRTDVYALGAILYHTLTGRPPYLGDGLADIVQQVLHTDPVAPRLLNGALPRDVETICLKCLEKEPAKRYSTAQAMADELDRFLKGQPILARPLGAVGKTCRWCRCNPRLAGALGLALVSMALGFTGVSWQWRRAETQRQRAESGELLARRNAYAADMKEVQRTLEENDLGQALEILNRHRPAGRSEGDLRGWEWRYFWGRCQSDPHTVLCRGSNSVSALAFSADGKWLAVRRSDGAVSLWDALARAPVLELPGRLWGTHKALALSSHGSLLAWASTDEGGKPAIRLWDWRARKDIANLPHSEPIVSVAFSPDAAMLATLDYGGMVRVWDFGSNQIVLSFRTERNDVYSDFAVAREAAASPVTNWANGPSAPVPLQPRTRYGTASLWADHYGSVLFSPDGRLLVVGEAAPRLRLRNLITGEETIIEVAAPADAITALAFSPDSKQLAGACGVADNDVHLWDLATGLETRLAGHTAWIAGLAFSPDGRELVSAGADQSIRLWEVSRKRERKRFRSNTDEIWAVAWSPDGRYFATGAKDGSVRLWDPATDPRQFTYKVLPSQSYFWEPAFLPDSQSFLTALRPDGRIVRWNATTLLEIETLPWLGTNHTCLAFSSDNRWLALGDSAGNVQVWDYRARLCVTNLVIPQASVMAVFFSPRDRFLACGAFAAGRVTVGKIWAVEGWRELSLEGIDLRHCTEAVFSPDERTLAVGYLDKGAAWWDLATRKLRASFAAPGGGGPVVAFSPNGARFAAASFSGLMTVWEGATQRSRSIGRAYSNGLNDLIFSLDGRRLVAIGTSPKGVLKLWDNETGREVAAFPTPLDWFCHLGFSPDGNTLFATSLEGSVLFWHAPCFSEIEAAEKNENASGL